MSEPWLSLRGLRVGFAGAPDVVDGLDLELGRGEALALAGESGSGKTLLALALSGLLPRAARVSGSIRLAGRELFALAEEERALLRGETLSMLVQEPRLALEPVLRVGAQLEELARLRLGLAREGAREAARRALREAGFAEPERVLGLYPHELSGGMAQRAALALASLLEPELLVADEPTSALDAALRRELVLRLEARRRERGTALLWISHDLASLEGLPWRLAVMYAGRVVEEGPLGRVLARPRHPYGAALIGALPRAGRPLRALPGRLPAPSERPSGCRFRERCALARERCAREEPALLPVGEPEDGHRSACWFAEEVEAP